MRRREFITLIGSAPATWPLAVRAQQSWIRRLGVISGFAESDAVPQRWITVFVQELRELGWRPGDNIQIEYR